MPSRTMEIIFKAVDNASATTKKISKSLTVLSTAVLLRYARMAARATVATVKLGAQSLYARDRLVAFAGGVKQANEMLDALVDASDGTIDRMTAMSQASRMIATDVANTTTEMGIAGAMVAKLGVQTWTTERRINSLTLLLANKSKRRLDDFGLSIDSVNERQKKLEAQGLSTTEAFRTAVFAEAAQQLGVLGDVSETAQVQVMKLEAVWNTFKQTVGEAAVELAMTSGVLGDTTDYLEDLTAHLNEAGEVAEYTENSWLGLNQAFIMTQASAKGWQEDEEELRESLKEEEQASRDAAAAAILKARADDIAAAAAQHRADAEKNLLASIRAFRSGQAARHQQWMDIRNEEVDASLAVQGAKWDAIRDNEKIYTSLEKLERDHQRRMESIAQGGGGGGIQSRMGQIAKRQQRAMDALADKIDARNWQTTLEDMLQNHLDRLASIRDNAMETEEQRENARYDAVLDRLDAEQQARLDALREQYGRAVSGEDQRADLEEEHRRRMAGLYTQSARDREIQRHAEAMNEFQYEQAEADLIATFAEEKEAAEATHQANLKEIADRAVQNALAAEVQRYEDQVAAATDRRILQQEDNTAREAILKKFNALREQEQQRMRDAQAGAAAAAREAMLVAEQESYEERRAELEAELADNQSKIVKANTSVATSVNTMVGQVDSGFQTMADRVFAFAHNGMLAADILKQAGKKVKKAWDWWGGNQPWDRPPQYAAGTDYHPGGMAIVGERGIEVLNLPKGTSVTPIGRVPTGPSDPRPGPIVIKISVNGDTDISMESARKIARATERQLKLLGVRSI